jgi:hypothetical protein
MVSNAAKYDIEDKVLVQEIQQLGLPKENSEMISKQYRESRDALRAKFSEDSYRIARLMSTDWRVDTILSSSTPTAQVSDKIVHLNMHIDTRPGEDNACNKYKNLAFEVPAVKLDVMIRELTQVLQMMQSLDT